MDLEKTVEFLLEQQARSEAQFAARQDQLQALVGRIAERQLALTQHVEQLQALVGRLAERQLALTQHVEQFQREIGAVMLAIAEQQKLQAEAQRRLAEEQVLLAEAQRHTDGRLNLLINVVDGIVRRPGK